MRKIQGNEQKGKRQNKVYLKRGRGQPKRCSARVRTRKVSGRAPSRREARPQQSRPPRPAAPENRDGGFAEASTHVNSEKD